MLKNIMAHGILFIVSAPSGTGKSSLIQELLHTESSYNIKLSISHTTRIKRPGEYDGEHYYFISDEEFKTMIKNEYFLEYAKVFSNYYGTARHLIEHMLTAGIDVFLDIDWQGAQQIRCKFPESKSIFLLPPSIKELYQRLKSRGQDSDGVIHTRMQKSIDEIKHYIEYDYLIINDDFKTAIHDVKNIIRSEHLCLLYQKKKYSRLIAELLQKS